MEHSWLEIIERLGIPVGMLAFVSYGIWQAGGWLGVTIIAPLKDRHLQFLDSLQTTLKILAEGQTALAKEMETITKIISGEWHDPNKKTGEKK